MSTAIVVPHDLVQRRRSGIPRLVDAGSDLHTSARLLLSPCAWAVVPEHDDTKEPHGRELPAVRREAADRDGGRVERGLDGRGSVEGPALHRTPRGVARRCGQDTLPGLVISIATAGDLAQWHPHLHLLTTDTGKTALLAHLGARADRGADRQPRSATPKHGQQLVQG